MAKRLFEEERIRAIGATLKHKLKSPSGFTTAEMPQAIERLHEHSRKSGLNDGYQAGYAEGYHKGLSITARESYETGYSEGYKQCADDGGNSYDKGYDDGKASGETLGHSRGYNEGYSQGSSEGADNLKKAEARSADDIVLFDSTITVPSGYYAERITKEIDMSQAHSIGHSEGYYEGYDIGYTRGYAKGLDDGTGVILPALANPGTENDLLYGKELLDGNGNIVKGAIMQKSAYDIVVDDANFIVVIPSGLYNQGTVIDISAYYDSGYADGRDDALPPLTNPGTSTDLLFDKQLIDGEGNIVEGKIYTRSGDDVGLIGLDVTIPEGYYPEKVEKTIDGGRIYMEGHSVGYQTGYSDGLTEGAATLKREEGRTAEDVTGRVDFANDFANVDIPSGYYAESITKQVSLTSYYNTAYDEGYDDCLATYKDGNGVKY